MRPPGWGGWAVVSRDNEREYRWECGLVSGFRSLVRLVSYSKGPKQGGATGGQHERERGEIEYPRKRRLCVKRNRKVHQFAQLKGAPAAGLI
jgi:hypothetical protein